MGKHYSWISTHSFGLKSDGTLWAWGFNSHGQLGDGTNVNRSSPAKIGIEQNWISLKAGNQFTLGLKSDRGQVCATGNNGYGELGDGTNENKSSFVCNTTVINNAPTITCVDNQTRSTDPDVFNYMVQSTEFDPIAYAGNISAGIINNSYNQSSTLANAIFPVGTTTVVWTVTDSISNDTATCSFDVTINSQCPSDIYLYSQSDVDSFQYKYPDCQFRVFVNY
ncbi:MAG: HYR domain-containing protein [Saprospiraceae bacterium]|nr:HYR domain-containing protein [Candidatus Defluviibacterium haderslevense]